MRLANSLVSSRLVGVLVIASLAALSGCSSVKGMFGGNKDTEAASYEPEKPAATLYNEGVAYMNKGNLKAAANSFSEVDRQHPYSEQARKALLMVAFANYRRSQDSDALSAAKRYLALYPGSPDAAYAQYLVGVIYFRQSPDVTRDQDTTKQSIAAMENIVNNYPKSEYAPDARQKLIEAKDLLAGKEMQIGRYYLERRDYLAAVNRFKTVVTDYQDTRQVEEALFRLTEAYLSLGLNSEAQTAAAVLGHNFPNSSWYKDAHTRLAGGGLSPSENKGSWISRTFGGKKTKATG
jgi:outer membrane protein assembly factor BamD